MYCKHDGQRRGYGSEAQQKKRAEEAIGNTIYTSSSAEMK